MRTGWLSIVVFVLTAAMARAADRISIEATLDTDSNTVVGIMEWTLPPRASFPADLRFQLYPNQFVDRVESGGVVVESLFVDGHDITAAMEIDGTDLYVPLPERFEPGESLLVRACFTSRLPHSWRRFGRYAGQYSLVAWYPAPAPYRNGDWQKIEYRPFLEPYAELVDFEAVVHVPDSLNIIAPGLRFVESADGLTTARIELEAANSLPLVIASGYETDSVSVLDDVMLRVYYRPEHRHAVDSLCRSVVTTLEYMSEYVAPYPFGELNVVIGGLWTDSGLELPRMILMGPPPRVFQTRIYWETVIHEVIHQWFYGLVNSNQAVAPWLDEAVTQYFTEKVIKETAGGDGADLISCWGLTLDNATTNRFFGRPVFDLTPLDQPVERLCDDDEYYRVIYGKGPKVIHTLTALMGPVAERRFWQEYVSQYRFRTPRPEDFIRIADKYLPRTDRADARTLLGSCGATDFEIISLSSERVSVASDSVDTSAVPAERFDVVVEYAAHQPLGFPVDLRVEFFDGTVVDTVLEPWAGRNSVTFTAGSPAVGAVIDPEYKYAIDMNLLNNSLVKIRSRGAGLRLFSGITFLVESLFSTLWGL